VNVQAQALYRAAREAGKAAVESYLKAGNTFADRIRECFGKPDKVIDAWQEGALARFTIDADAYVKANGGSVKVVKGARTVETDGSVGAMRSLKSIQNDCAKLKAILRAFRKVNARIAAGEDAGAWKAALAQGTVHTLYAACVNVNAYEQHETISADQIHRLVSQAMLRKANAKQGTGQHYRAIAGKVRMLNAAELLKLEELVRTLRAAHSAARVVKAREQQEQQAMPKARKAA
jgi:hypothetical protein